MAKRKPGIVGLQSFNKPVVRPIHYIDVAGVSVHDGRIIETDDAAFIDGLNATGCAVDVTCDVCHNQMAVVQATRVEYAVWRLTDVIHTGERAKDRFNSFVAKHGLLYALRTYSIDTLKDVAAADVAKALLAIVQDPTKGLEQAREVALYKALNGAKWPTTSSNPMIEVEAAAVVKAFAEFAER